MVKVTTKRSPEIVLMLFIAVGNVIGKGAPCLTPLDENFSITVGLSAIIKEPSLRLLIALRFAPPKFASKIPE